MWRISWAEFFARWEGWKRRYEWERAHHRETFALLYNINTKQGHQQSAQKLMPLPLIDPTPGEKAVKDFTPEEKANLLARFRRKPKPKPDAVTG